MSNYKYIIGGRSSGKTRKLLELAKENGNAVVICKNPYALARKAEAYGIFGLHFMGYGEVVNGIREEAVSGLVPGITVAIDEIKEFFDYLLATDCIGFTLTEEEDV